MKSSTLIKFIFFITISFPCFVQAQINYGGTPYSFGSDFKSLKSDNQSISSLKLPKLNWQKIRQEDESKPNSNRFAAAIPVDFDLKKSGKWLTLPNGDRLWRLKIHSEGALGLRVLFSKFKLAQGSKLFLYTENQQTVLGAFTHLNNLESGRMGTEVLPQSTIVIEYYEPQNLSEKTELQIWRIDHAYRYMPNLDKGFEDSGACNVNVNCPLGNNWQVQKRGVVKIITTENGGSDWCSGSLINNSRQDRTPYVLSAFHCLDDRVGNAAQQFVDTWVFIFNYESPTCVNPAVEPPQNQSIAGGTITAGLNSSDFLLIRLSSAVPDSYNAYFNGWDRSGDTPNNTTSIHHPSGDVKKISVDKDASLKSTYQNVNSGEKNHWRIRWDESTTTEGGSSGSPLFDQNQRIIGQLHGGSASCSNLTAPDYYGMLSDSWTKGSTPQTRLRDWLDPLNVGILSLNGLESQIVNNDISILTANLPILACNQFKFLVYNKGANNQTNISITYELRDLNNNLIKTGNSILASLAAGTTQSVNFEFNEPTIQGNYNLIANVELSNEDANPNDNSLTQLLTILPRINSYPYQTSFETDNGTWASSGNINDWVWATPQKTRLNRASNGQKAWFTRTSGNYRANHDGYLISPIFDLSNLAGATLTADIFFETEVDFDGVQLQVSTDCGQTWQKLGSPNTGINWYNNESNQLLFTEYGNQAWSGQSGGWKTILHSLSDYQGQAQVVFRFLFLADDITAAEGFAVDNFRVISLDNDVLLTNIISDVSPCEYANNTPFKFQVKNAGFKAQTNVKLEYQLFQNQTQLVSSGSTTIPNLAVNQSQELTINLSLANSNTAYLIKAEVKLDNIEDQNPVNNQKQLELFSTISRFPYRQGFEGTRGGWESGGKSSSWELGVPQNIFIDRASEGDSAWVTNLDGKYNNNEDSFVESPAFDFSNIKNPYLLVDIAQDLEVDFDGVQLQISEDCGASWERLGTVQSGKNWYNNASFDLPFGDFGKEAWSLEETYWATAGQSLRNYAGKKNLLLRWSMRSDATFNTEGFGFDNIRILEVDDLLKNSVLLYPNPANDILNINIEPSLGDFQVMRITIFDLMGKEIQQSRLEFIGATSGGVFQMPVDKLRSGVYLLKFETEKGNFNKKIIKY
jgi:hypothetical protein